MTFIETQTFETLAPFDLALSSIVFSEGDLKVRGYHNDYFSQIVKTNGKLILAKLYSIGNPETGKLSLELQSNNPLTIKEVEKAKQAISQIFSLNLPLKAFYKETKSDPIMSQITQKLYGFKFPNTLTVFEALVDAIVEQQISIKVARAIEERLAIEFGESLRINDDTYFAFPTPQLIVKAGVDKIRQVGLSKRKAGYIFGAAQMIFDGKLDLENLKDHLDAEQIIEVLDEIRGIGVWTAELTMLRGMQMFDVLPADDFGIRRVISRYYCNGQVIKADEARRVAEAWGDWKGLAAFYLMVAEVKGIEL